MTATTPEDVQISLGHLTGATKGYAGNGRIVLIFYDPTNNFF